MGSMNLFDKLLDTTTQIHVQIEIN